MYFVLGLFFTKYILIAHNLNKNTNVYIFYKVWLIRTYKLDSEKSRLCYISFIIS